MRGGGLVIWVPSAALLPDNSTVSFEAPCSVHGASKLATTTREKSPGASTNGSLVEGQDAFCLLMFASGMGGDSLF